MDEVKAALTPRLTKYIPHVPTAKQQAGLLMNQREVLYGGAAGGGKSDWLLMSALQYVDVPGYAALLLRRTFRELLLEGGLMERSHKWLDRTDAKWHGSTNSWRFPSGAVLTFGYLDQARQHERYQGSNWLFVGFDELTQFPEHHYRYLFSRLRRPQASEDTPARERAMIEALHRVPIRMRAASNPGGIGHEWVKARFGIYPPQNDPQGRLTCHRPEWVESEGRVFVPAGLADNPHLDTKDYEKSLAELDPVTRAQVLRGDWDARTQGGLFRSEWFHVQAEPPKMKRVVRFWDLAATEVSESATDPDYTAGVKLGMDPDGVFYVLDVQRFRARPEGVERRIRQAAENDGRNVPVLIEQEPGSAGKNTIWQYQRSVLPEFEVRGIRSSGSKEERARPVSAKAEANLVRLIRGTWILEFLDELESFPEGGHDDQVDALAGAWAYLATKAAAPSIGPEVWK